MKIKPIIIIICSLICVILIFSIIVVLTKNGWLITLRNKLVFKPNKEIKLIKNQLTSTTWLGLSIEVPGFEGPARDKIAEDLILTFKENGRCLLERGDEHIKAGWGIKDDRLSIRGGIKADANLSLDVFCLDEFSSTITDFLLHYIDNYSVRFYSVKYLEELDKITFNF